MGAKKSSAKKSSATKKTPAKKKRAAKKASSAKPVMPDVIYAQASPRSVGGVSMFEAQHQIDSETVENFVSEESRSEAAVEMLEQAGFEILQVSEYTINIAGSRATYDAAFNTKLYVESRPAIKELGKEDLAEFIDSPSSDLPGLIATEGTPFEDILEGVAIEEPRYYMGPNFNPPLKQYWHLHPPGDLSAALNADRAHRAGLTGRGIKVAMVDSGWFRHPYFTVRGYNVANAILGPGAVSPLTDESGHGTGESANIFAVAPDVQLLPVKMSFTNSIGAFNAAVGLGPHIITCSWGSSTNGPLSAADMALATAIASAVAAGIIVVFSAGNGHFGFPGQHPDVISAGGVFMRPDETLTASDYASGFASMIYAGRKCPDLSGLVGMKPKAIYIMLPVQPGDDIDATPPPLGLSGGTFPNGDQTGTNDGWGAFSGTSAAAPQLAGAAAIVKQACPKLKPFDVRDVLMKTARDVTTGTNNNGNTAGPGFDLATGAGLVDVHKAAVVGKLKCVPIIGPPIIAPAPISIAAEPSAAEGGTGGFDQPFGPAPIKPIAILPPIKPITIKPPIKPIVIQPPIKPPILVKPPITVKPPIVVKPPITIKPPIKPITIKPPIVVKPPIIIKNPIVVKPPIKPPIVGPGPGPDPFNDPSGGGQQAGGLSQEEVSSIEQMIVDGGVDVD
jgi:subtilisin family serine protease